MQKKGNRVTVLYSGRPRLLPYTVSTLAILEKTRGVWDRFIAVWDTEEIKGGVVLQISSFTLNYVYFCFELFLVMTHFVGDS